MPVGGELWLPVQGMAQNHWQLLFSSSHGSLVFLIQVRARVPRGMNSGLFQSV